MLWFFSLGVWLSGSIFAQTTWEFSGTPYAYQKAHLDSSTKVIMGKLGIRMHTFGAPYNQIDTTFIRVFSEDTSYKVLLFGQLSPAAGSNQVNLKNRVNIESATGVPDYATFIADYTAKKSTFTDYMVMQGHAYAWTTDAKQTEFRKIITYLLGDSVLFSTPLEYYRYLTDNSIPRTNKVHVILKLDDLRAASSYFYPCFTAYDYLVANGIKAGFGVNNMQNLTQAQIDTLSYYLRQKDQSGQPLFEIWNHGLDHSMTAATVGGNWSAPASWPGGSVPTSADDVVIPAGITITLDIPDAACNDLTIDGSLFALNTAATGLTVNGDLLIESGGSFISPSLTGATANIIHSLNVYGNFTNNGGTFDFKIGSAGTTMRVMNTTFLGDYNSTINVGTYSSSNNDFNGITVNKSGKAKLICASDVVCDPGASGCVSQLVLKNGIVETGVNTIYALSTASTDVVSASTASYVSGALGRGMSNSAGKTNTFPVGDANGFRPIAVKSTTAGTATGHNVVVRVVPADANTVGETLTGGIDSVSRVRYYQISYNKGIGAGATSMSFSQFSPSYGPDDNIQPGNTNLRVAFSTDERLTWNGMQQTTTHNTDLSNPPTTITPTALVTPLTLNSGSGYLYVSLAKVNGVTTETEHNETVLPKEFTLSQNYPNPFNPTTAIRYSLPQDAYVRLAVYSLTGELLSTLINQHQKAGSYEVVFDAHSFASGIYVYRLNDGTHTLVRKMLLVK